jgi:hypothetical protein
LELAIPLSAHIETQEFEHYVALRVFGLDKETTFRRDGLVWNGHTLLFAEEPDKPTLSGADE